MNHRDKISILSTFTIGMIVGVYIYLTGFATTFKLPEVVTQNAYTELVVTADSYGKCEEEGTCFAFQLIGDGTYRAIFDPAGERVVVEDKIKKSLRRELAVVLTLADLTRQAAYAQNEECIGMVVDNQYRFSINLGTSTYLLDTCTTAVEKNSQVWLTLSKVWTVLSTSY